MSVTVGEERHDGEQRETVVSKYSLIRYLLRALWVEKDLFLDMCS